MSTENESMFGGGGLWIFALLILLMLGGGIGLNRTGEFGNFATAASQSEILLGQQFSSLDNKIDRLGNGIADATFALNDSVVSEGRGIQSSICGVKEAVHAEGEATRALIQQNKIESLQQKISALEMQNAMSGVVRYPMANVYTSGSGPFCSCTGNAF